MAKAHAQSWEVTDEFWRRVEPLVPQPVRDPQKQYKRAAGAGRPAKPPRLLFEAIVFVLRTGCQWKALPFERFGSASAIHQKFMVSVQPPTPSILHARLRSRLRWRAEDGCAQAPSWAGAGGRSSCARPRG